MPPIPVPVNGQIIDATTWGAPVANAINSQWIQAGIVSGTTSATGSIALAFPKAFGSVPIIELTDAASAAGGVIIAGVQAGATAAGCTVWCRRSDIANTPQAASIAVSIAWIAVGTAPAT